MNSRECRLGYVTFQILIDEVPFVFAYIESVVFASHDLKERYKHLRQVFERLARLACILI